MNTLDKRANELDQADPLRTMRNQFHIPNGLIYLDGNSLGLMPLTAAAKVAEVTGNEWANGLIRSWTDAGWFHLPTTVGDRIAPIIGGNPGEVTVADSTSVNLFKCLAAALHLNPDRQVILAEGDNFPTDSYMAQGLAGLVPDVTVRYFESHENPADCIGDDVAVVLLSHVDYRSSRIRDMTATSKAVQEKGALILWDLSHTSGAVACELNNANADMAVGCSYKYLNGGPGAPAFTWVNQRHAASIRQPLSGWLGHAAPFDFSREFAPADNARRMVCGTPPVISMAALDEALKLWENVDLAALWNKSSEMTAFFIEAVEQLCQGHNLTLASPRNNSERGSHVSFELDGHGFEVMQAMVARGVIGDFRSPSTLRFGFAPLYLSFQEVLQAAQHLAEILETREWDNEIYRVRGAVT
ncbi:kynureninase [Chromatiales bacterium (ex Bugula neritina AB1)]|nr:kynureninase [Chromatiales bacterium (ex Bugula neritina AB1)]